MFDKKLYYIYQWATTKGVQATEKPLALKRENQAFQIKTIRVLAFFFFYGSGSSRPRSMRIWIQNSETK